MVSTFKWLCRQGRSQLGLGNKGFLSQHYPEFPHSGTLRPKYFSRIVAVGFKVVIEMELTSQSVDKQLRKVTWYKNGHVIDTKSSSKSSRIWEVRTINF